MSINGLNVTSPISARYWLELKDLGDTEKIELIALLSCSMTSTAMRRSSAPKENRASTFASKWQGDQNERLDAALARFHGDWGGEKDPVEIARELRQGPEMVRDVETW